MMAAMRRRDSGRIQYIEETLEKILKLPPFEGVGHEPVALSHLVVAVADNIT